MRHSTAVPVAVRKVLSTVAPTLVGTGFALAGGTSLALRFGHRMSVDLDFFTLGEFAPESLERRLRMVPEQVMDRSEGTLRLLVQGVKIDFLRHAYPLLEAPEVLDDIAMWSVMDVAAMKLNAITNRGSKKDFFDLQMLLRHYSLPTLLDAYCAKYAVVNRFMVIRSLAWFDDAESEPDPVSLTRATWQSVKSRISKAVAGLG